MMAFLFIIDVSISDMDKILGIVSGLLQIMVMICGLSVFSTCVPLSQNIQIPTCLPKSPWR